MMCNDYKWVEVYDPLFFISSFFTKLGNDLGNNGWNINAS